MDEFIVPVRFSGSRETKTYVFLFKSAQHALSEAERSEETKIYNLMSAYVFLAFAFEAYLNHLGAKLIPNWDKNEKKWGRDKRIDKVFEKLEVAVEYENRPYSAIPSLFSFRDTLAHGRTEVAVATNEVKNVDWLNIGKDNPLVPPWLRTCTTENARQALTDIGSIINTLGAKVGERHPLKSLGSGTFTYERLDRP